MTAATKAPPAGDWTLHTGQVHCVACGISVGVIVCGRFDDGKSYGGHVNGMARCVDCQRKH